MIDFALYLVSGFLWGSVFFITWLIFRDIIKTIKGKIKQGKNCFMIKSKGIYKVIFKKKDGSVRELLGTKDDTFFNYEHKNGKNKTDKNIECIFDLKKKEWRSFRKDSVIMIEKLESIPEGI